MARVYYVTDPVSHERRLGTPREAAAEVKSHFRLPGAELARLARGPQGLTVCSLQHVLYRPLGAGARAITVADMNHDGALVLVQCPNGEERWILREQHAAIKAEHARFMTAQCSGAVMPPKLPQVPTPSAPKQANATARKPSPPKPRPSTPAARSAHAASQPKATTNMAKPSSKRAASLLRKAASTLEQSDDVAEAVRLMKKAITVLNATEKDNDDDDEDQPSRSRAPFDKAECQAALVKVLTKLTTSTDPQTRAEAAARLERIAPERLALRRRMGLGATAGAPFRVENDTFVSSAAAFAQSKGQRA